MIILLFFFPHSVCFRGKLYFLGKNVLPINPFPLLNRDPKDDVGSGCSTGGGTVVCYGGGDGLVLKTFYFNI